MSEQLKKIREVVVDELNNIDFPPPTESIDDITAITTGIRLLGTLCLGVKQAQLEAEKILNEMADIMLEYAEIATQRSKQAEALVATFAQKTESDDEGKQEEKPAKTNGVTIEIHGSGDIPPEILDLIAKLKGK